MVLDTADKRHFWVSVHSRPFQLFVQQKGSALGYRGLVRVHWGGVSPGAHIGTHIRYHREEPASPAHVSRCSHQVSWGGARLRLPVLTSSVAHVRYHGRAPTGFTCPLTSGIMGGARFSRPPTSPDTHVRYHGGHFSRPLTSTGVHAGHL